MRRILLDSNVFLWAATRSSQLSPGQTEALGAGELVFVSVASVWELGIKAHKGHLSYLGDFSEFLAEAIEGLGIDLLEITERDALVASSLPHPNGHKDPFDRMIVAQCINRELTLLSSDALLHEYGINVVS